MRAAALCNMGHGGRFFLFACAIVAGVLLCSPALGNPQSGDSPQDSPHQKPLSTKKIIKPNSPSKTPISVTARSIFWRLPTTIFENTVQGLSEEEKYELFTLGGSQNWVVRKATRDTIELKSRPDEDSTVILTLFRQPGSPRLVAAIGTDTGSMCATELWSVDSTGRASPMATPPDPSLYDFFNPGTPIPADVTASLPFCVHPAGLEVRPLFWTSTGVAHVMVDNAVFYLWTDAHFSKRIVPLPPFDPTFDPSPSVHDNDWKDIPANPPRKPRVDVVTPAGQ